MSEKRFYIFYFVAGPFGGEWFEGPYDVAKAQACKKYNQDPDNLIEFESKPDSRANKIGINEKRRSGELCK